MKYVYYVDFIPHSAFTPVVLSCKRVYAVCMRVRHSKKMENVSACFFSLVYVSSSFLLYSLLCVWYVFEYTLLFCVTIDVFSRFCRCKQTHQHTNTANERVCVCVFGTLNALLRDSIDTAHSTQLWQHTLAMFLFWPIAAHSCRSIIIILAMFRYAILIIDGFSVEPMQLAHLSGVSTNDQRNGKWYCESLSIIVNAQYPEKRGFAASDEFLQNLYEFWARTALHWVYK